eukprot:4177092-Amphidinium_carterae.1
MIKGSRVFLTYFPSAHHRRVSKTTELETSQYCLHKASARKLTNTRLGEDSAMFERCSSFEPQPVSFVLLC